MAVPLALKGRFDRFGARLKLPESVPQFGDRVYAVYRLLWFAAFALALIGPGGGIYQRFTNPADNSGLMLGSRLGVVLAEEDATRIRFPVGPQTQAAGIKAGDKLVAIDGFPLPDKMPFAAADLDRNQMTPAYILLANIVYGTGESQVQLSIKSPGGQVREVPVTVGEQHIEDGARSLGIAPGLLRFVDLLHVATYPFLLLAAWFLHRRQPRDPVSCIISIAILFSMGTEAPSANFLEDIVGLPRPIHAFLYDLGNVCLLGGILLFPHGKLSPRLLLLIAALPALFFLHGDIYRALFMFFMLCAVLMLISCLRRLEQGEVRQQIKWALFGFSGYVLFLTISLVLDMIKPQTESFTTQLIMEMTAGLSLGIAFLMIQLGLLIALVRYRLYDAEFVISQSATFAAITLILGGTVAGVIQGLGTTIQNTFGANAGAGAAGLGAAMATVLINPAYERINKWMEQRFHKNLMELQNGLPETVRDLREVAPLPELLQEILFRVNTAVQPIRSAIVVEGAVQLTSNVSHEEATEWLSHFSADEEKQLVVRSDPLFQVRVPLTAHGQLRVGWLLVGPRPDGTPPRDDERDVLVEVADPIARAIRIVLKRDREDHEMAELLEEMRQRIEDIELGLLGELQSKKSLS